MIRFLSSILLIFLAGCTPPHFIARKSGGVSVYLDAPQASKVIFVSSADGFREHSASRDSKGLWSIENLADREFHYFFIVDGRIYVPDCRYKENDDFGARNCIYQPQ